jgi:hypothetical protein
MSYLDGGGPTYEGWSSKADLSMKIITSSKASSSGPTMQNTSKAGIGGLGESTGAIVELLADDVALVGKMGPIMGPYEPEVWARMIQEL